MNSMFKNIQAKSTCPFTVFTWVCTLVILAVLAMAHPWKFCLNTFNMFCFPQHQLQALLRVDIVMLYLCMLTKHVHIFTSWLLAFVSFSVSLPTIFLHAHIATSRITGRSFLRSVSISFFLSFRSSSCTPNLSTKSIYIYIYITCFSATEESGIQLFRATGWRPQFTGCTWGYSSWRIWIILGVQKGWPWRKHRDCRVN